MSKITRLNAEKIRLQVIYDNNPADSGFQEAWGFSCLIAVDDKTILFDTGGDSEVFSANFHKIEIEPGAIDAVMISHDHWDHNSGINEFLNLNNMANFYILSSFSDETKTVIESAGDNIKIVDQTTELFPGCLTTGRMSTNRENLFEHSLLLRTDKGTIIVTGCAHSGIINVVKRSRLLINDDVFLLIGGLHLIDSGAEYISSIVNRCSEMDVKYVAPCHCTGEIAKGMFKEVWGDKYIGIVVGTVIEPGELQ